MGSGLSEEEETPYPDPAAAPLVAASITPIRIFLASPGGVEDERRAVREAAEDLNKSLRPQGWQIEIKGWGERGPAGGRAQADINKDVNACDVLLALVWDSWGTPTGDSTSGFAEEWALAVGRRDRTEVPDLWLYFKELPADVDEDDDQIRLVRQFRREIAEKETAFYKPFSTVEEFTSLIRVRLLTLALERSGLTRVDIGGAAVDWSAAYHEDPAWLVADGRERQSLADELVESDPGEAAPLLSGLADDVEATGFTQHARRLRARACEAYLAAGRSGEAIRLVRVMLGQLTWWMAFDEIPGVLQRLAEKLPPEMAPELTGWGACAGAAEDPVGTITKLEQALKAEHAIALDAESVGHWRAILWRCRLHEGQGDAVAAEDITVPGTSADDLELELAMLHADALRAAGDARADAAWQQLRALALNCLENAPESAAWIQTRAALDLANSGRLTAAESGYADVASRWAHLTGRQDSAAQCFFSAQAASRLEDPWKFAGWGMAELAASQRTRGRSFVGRAEQLEQQALHQRLEDQPEQAIAQLLAASWCHERAGVLSGILKDRSLLAAAHEAAGEHTTAVVLHCLCKERKAAENAATQAGNRRDLVEELRGRWPDWTLEARLGALSRVGRSASPQAAAELVGVAMAAIRQPEKRLDNTRSVAAEALVSVTLAVEDAELGASAANGLSELARENHYAIATAGRNGLRMLVDVGQEQYLDQLIELFMANPQVNEPDVFWVADRIGGTGRASAMRTSALAGNHQALTALVRAGLVESDDELRRLCHHITKLTLASDLGMAQGGGAIAGLLALGRDGAIAAATGDESLCREFAETLLLYASETKWPMNNRVSALEGIWELREHLVREEWVERLKPLASPEDDLDEETAPWLRGMWVERGDLEAMALRAAAALAESAGSPEWLRETVKEALFDERPPVLQAGWFATGIHAELFDPHLARHALAHAASEVRVAVLHAWQRSGHVLPAPPLRRLAQDPDNHVRFAVLDALTNRYDDEAANTLRADTDAYVRRIAVRRLSNDG